MFILKDLVLESTVLKNPMMDKIAKDLIKDFKDFIKNGTDEEYVSVGAGPLYLRVHKYSIIDKDNTSKKVQLQFNIQQRDLMGAHFIEGENGKNGLIELFVPFAVKAMDKSAREKYLKSEFNTFCGSIYHEVQHALKYFIYGYGSTASYQSKIKKYESGKPPRAEYYLNADEWESLLAEIKFDIVEYFKDVKNVKNNLSDALDASDEFRKTVSSMIDREKLSNTELAATTFLSPELMEFIYPKYVRLYKTILKKIIDWFLQYKKEIKLKVPHRTPIHPANFEFK